MNRPSLMKTFALAVTAICLVVSPQVAKDKTTSGTLIRIEPSFIEIRINKQKTQMVKLTAETKYDRWYFYKRGYRDSRAVTLESLIVGMHLRIETPADGPSTALKVWIVVR